MVMKKKMLLKDANKIRKEQSKHILQKITNEKLFNVKFENDKEYSEFLDVLHQDIPFEESRKIIGSVICDQLNDGVDLLTVIQNFKEYVDNYVLKHKETNGNIEEDDELLFVEGMMYECLEDGIREIGDLEQVTSIMYGFLYKQYTQHNNN